MKANLYKLKSWKIILFVFWYLASFPGKLGYDYSLLTRMVQKGESTAWWGASYFWIFKILTFSGSQIYLLSFLGLLSLTFSLKSFIGSLPINSTAKDRVLTFIMATPLYGVFGVTVSHDVFQTSGLLIFSSLLLTATIKGFSILKGSRLEIFLASLFLLTTQTGILIIAVFCSILIFRGVARVAIETILLSTILYLCANFGISQGQTSISFVQSTLPRLMLVDIKCIVQHPEAQISNEEWLVLERYAPKSSWLKPTNCSNPDDLVAPLKLDLFGSSKMKLDSELLRTFFSVVSKNPAIPVMSHIQRSRMALPPPFFQPPTNQIPWDVNIPIGQGTNTALQSGPGLLHPSIDEKSVEVNVSFLSPLRTVAQALTLLVNQASWFWGWGGLWLWPLIYFIATRFNISSFGEFLMIISPTLILHITLFLIGPSSLGRYVMSSVFQGIIVTLIMAREKVKKLDQD
jgi:hypothetical protein